MKRVRTAIGKSHRILWQATAIMLILIVARSAWRYVGGQEALPGISGTQHLFYIVYGAAGPRLSFYPC